MTSEEEADVCIHQNTGNKSAVTGVIEITAGEATQHASNSEEIKILFLVRDHAFCIRTQNFPKNTQIISYFLIHITHFDTHYTLHISHIHVS